VDFADVQTVMTNRGMAMMGLGTAEGEGRAERAVEAALACPLLDDIELSGARGILVTLAHNGSLTRKELQTVNERVLQVGDPEADMKFGITIDESLGDQLRVTVVATGLAMRRQVDESLEALDPQLLSGKVTPFMRPEAAQPQPQPQMAPVSQQQPQPQAQAPLSARPRIYEGSAQPAAKAAASHLAALDLNQDLLDIPTFLRQQAD